MCDVPAGAERLKGGGRNPPVAWFDSRVALQVPVVQLDRCRSSKASRWGFDSSRGHQLFSAISG